MEVLRERYLDLMTFGGGQRPLLGLLFGAMVGLEGRWRRQGADRAEIDFSAFGFDYVRVHKLNVPTGFHGGPPEQVLAETDEYVLKRDSYGRRTKLYKRHASLFHPLEYPVTDMDSWLKFKPHYEFSDRRFRPGWDQQIDPDALVVVDIPGGFDEPRQLMGEEGLCIAYYEQPELIHDMIETITQTAQKVLERASSKVRIDQLSVHEDMAGKNGSLVGPNIIDEFIKPYYRRIWDMLESRGAKLFRIDTDGNVNSIIPSLLDAGINAMLPFEPAAGMDAVETRKTYARKLATIGGIDKFVLLKSKQEIRRELEYKMQALMQEGGTAFGVDHRIPEKTPLASFWYFVRTARELLGLEPDPQPAPNWQRLSF